MNNLLASDRSDQGAPVSYSNEYPDQGMFGLDITIFPGGIYVGISFRILSFIVNIDKIIYRIINFFTHENFVI